MSLEKKIMNDLKQAMLSKDSIRLEVCRSIKSAILLAKTEKGTGDLSDKKEIEILQKLYKQRKESYKIYFTKERLDLAELELAQANIIKTYLPQPLDYQDLEKIIDNLILELKINSKSDMGRLMSAVINTVKGRADGATISKIVKQKLG